MKPSADHAPVVRTLTAPAPAPAPAAFWGPVSGFYLVALLASGALAAFQPLTGISFEIIEIVQFGPAIAVGALLLASRRTLAAHRPRHGTRIGDLWSPSAGKALACASVPAAAVAALCVLAYALTGTSLPVRGVDELVAPLALVVVAQLIGSAGEELGWRCWLQPTLERRFSLLTSAVVVGLLWGAWHVQVFTVGALYAAAFLAGTVAMSITMALLIRRHGHHLVIASTFHLLINIGLLFLMNEEDGDVGAMLTFAGACVVTCVATALATGDRTTRVVRR